MMVLRRVRMVGRSYTVFVPVWFMPMIKFSEGDVIYAYLDGDKIVYSNEYKQGARRIKFRKAAAYKDRVYCGVTIPKEFANALGIKEKDVVRFEVSSDGTIVVSKP